MNEYGNATPGMAWNDALLLLKAGKKMTPNNGWGIYWFDGDTLMRSQEVINGRRMAVPADADDYEINATTWRVCE